MSLVDKTVRVRRGGSYLTIPANAVDRYMAKGYDVIDTEGNVVKASVPNDVNTLKTAYERHVAEIKELKAKNAELERLLLAQREVPETAKPVTKRSSKK